MTTAAGAVGSERPGLKPRAQSASPLKGAVRAPRRPGRSAGCRRRWDQPASAGLGTEPGRSRPGDREEGRSADRRCVSCETCRPRCIAAPSRRGGRGSASPRQGGGDASPVGHMGATVGRPPPCRGQAVPDSPPPRNRRDPSCVKHNGCSPSGDCVRGIAPGGLDGLARTLVDCARCRTGRRTRPVPGRSERRPRG
jgi:hypothetical protein